LKTLVIVGGGFSSTVAAVEFIRALSHQAELIIIDEHGNFGPGVAYSSQNEGHVLNVPAGNMSALTGDPSSFLSYCNERGLRVHSGSFISRVEYGRYLSALLNQSIAASNGKVTVRTIKGEVVHIVPEPSGAAVTLADGVVFRASHVLLACGNFPPSTPKPFITVAHHPAYLDAPWSNAQRAPQSTADSILLIGSGLTALDMIGRLARQGYSGKITTVSRRGLRPQVHRGHSTYTAHHAQSTQETMLNAQPTALDYLRTIRRLVEQTIDADWRDVVAALRPCTAKLWKRLSLDEKRRFLRHARPYWDNHRHRAAPESDEAVQTLIDLGKLKLLKGRILSAQVSERRIRCKLMLTATGEIEQHDFDLIINCTGPSTRVIDSSLPLIKQLLKDGLLAPDALGLGVEIDDDYLVINQSGEPVPWLSYIGPMLKSVYWEATAVPELRQHASAHAAGLARKFSGHFEP
jgi:uncharacterized NAD(P)/FAD-binding protein YdhS